MRASRWIALGGFAALALYLRAVPEPGFDRWLLDRVWEPPATQLPLFEIVTYLGDSRLLALVAASLAWRSGGTARAGWRRCRCSRWRRARS